jgi:EAL domain-containing protein (putative c-di-GMP-specific phosphodiesterase class I)
MSMLVNLSALELEQRGFGDGIREAIAASGITPHSLVLEITEHAVVRDVTRVRSVLDQLQGCGAHLVIDDFGTGYSSLSYLSSLPIDGLKIARPFVHDAAGDRRTVALLRAIVEVGAALGLVVVAEGIETRDELHLLRALGCDLGQGHYLASPMPAVEAQALVTAAVQPWSADLGRPAVAVGPGRSRYPRRLPVERPGDPAGSVRVG